MSDPLFAGVLARGPAAAAVGDREFLQAMLDFEAALARAQADAGLIEPGHAQAIAAACHAEDYDPTAIGAQAPSIGNPAGPLVKALTARVAGDARGHVHRGATSQDVVDTAMMLVARRALAALLRDLDGASDAAAALALAHRDTPMAGRTLMQQAVPTTFGLKAAGWCTGLDAAADRLIAVRNERLALQLGGAAGNLASLGTAGVEVMTRVAAELELAEPVVPWHADRTRIAELAGALAAACGAMAKVARDVVLLSQTEVAEVREGRGGGSSAMPHKHNPVAAVSVLGAARQAPAFAASLLANMEHEHERAAGAWHAEWIPLRALIAATGSAAAWLRDCLENLEVDPDRMRASLDLTGGLLLAERVTAALTDAIGRATAHELVERAARTAMTSGRPFSEVLCDDPQVRQHLGAGAVAELLDPTGYTGSAPALVDRALRAHDRRRSA